MRVDIMTDIETLGTKSNSTVFQVSAVAFNITTGQVFDTFNQVIDIEKENMIVDGSTIKWWLNTNKDLMKQLICDSEQLSAKEAFSNFRKWIVSQTEDIKNVYLWGNGILFDNNMIREQMIKYDLSYPIIYKNDRDVRTVVELASIKSEQTERQIKDSVKLQSDVEHDAYSDCLFQIRFVNKCYEIIMRQN